MSKAVADRLDFGCVMLDVTAKDEEAISPICRQLGVEMPNIKISIYKNRRGGYRGMYLWCIANKSVCQYTPIFASDWSYKFMPIEALRINVHSKEKGAF